MNFGFSCDRCPAFAQVKVAFDSGVALYLCGHHERACFPVDGNYEGITFSYATATIGG